MPPDPCKGCRRRGMCRREGAIVHRAIVAWLEGYGFSCDDFEQDNYHGIEGVLP